MQVNRVLVTKLFGLFEHDVQFKTRERITIIHGPNGVGKTTILKLIEAVFTPRFDVLQQVDYATLELRFVTRQRLVVTRNKAPREGQERSLTFTLIDGAERKQHTYPSNEGRHGRRYPLSMIESMVPNLTRIDTEIWLENTTGEHLPLGAVMKRYRDYLPADFLSNMSSLPEWLDELCKSVQVHFIQTQRLLATSEPPKYSSADRRAATSRMTVEDLAKDMARRVQDVLRSSGAVAASLDRTFPHRLLQGKLPSAATEKSIRRRYEEQSTYRKRLMDAGLLQPEETLPLQQEALDQSERKVLWYYLGDIDKKLAVYKDLLDRAELFTRIINDNKFLYKKLSIHKDRGFLFTSNNGANVPLSALSSGEQHELVLAYELLFRATQNALILIDEPELSLHVTWQHRFLDDMARISELADLDFLIATHSPSIVHRRTELMVELGEAHQ